MTRRPWLVLIAVLLGACAKQGSVLAIVRAVVPDPTNCVVKPDGNSPQRGRYDPVAGDGYDLWLVVRNNLEPRGENPIYGGGPNSVKPYANDATVLGLDTCWYVPMLEPETLTLGSHSGGLLVKCDELEANSRFVHTATTVPADDGEHLVEGEVLTSDDLQKVFGDAFDREALWGEAYDPVPYDTNGDGDTDDRGDFYFPTRISSPVPANKDAPCVGGRVDGRSGAWGCFPNRWTVTIVVQVRVVAQLLTGQMVSSGWFAYPIELSPGDTFRECEPVLLGQLCSDGSLSYLGEELARGACAPHNYYSEPQCLVHTGCPEDE